MKILSLWSFAFAFSVGLACAGVQIDWSSSPGAGHVQSDGTSALGSTFTFELGAFRDRDGAPFVPTRENRHLWREQWEVLDQTNYNPTSERFSASHAMRSNAAPFVLGGKVYLWGYDGLTSGSEWLLVSPPTSTWAWPLGNMAPPIPGNSARFRIADLTSEDAIFGAVNENGVEIQTEVIVLPLTYDSWSATSFSLGQTSTQPDDDPDRDGRSNFLEYALGSDPEHPDVPFSPEIDGPDEIRFIAPNDRLVDWRLLSGTDLRELTELTSGVDFNETSSGELTFRLTVDLGPKRFFQVVALPR